MNDNKDVLQKLDQVHTDVLTLHGDIKNMQAATLNIMADMQSKQVEANKEAVRANDLRDRQVVALEKQSHMLDKNTELLDKAITALADIKTNEARNQIQKSNFDQAKPWLVIMAGIMLFILVLFGVIDANRIMDRYNDKKDFISENSGDK